MVAYIWDRENCPLYGVAGCLLFRGCLSIEVNGRAVVTFRIVRYIVGVRYSGVSVKGGSTVYDEFPARLQSSCHKFCVVIVVCWSCPQATPRLYHATVEKSREKAWYQYYVTDRKWWTRFHNEGNVPTQYAANTASDRIVKLA